MSPLTPGEERKWNRLASGMQEFHTYLKYEYDEIYALADGKFNNRGMSVSTFLQTVLEFRKHLETHHSIEERFIFPMLAMKMPVFKEDERHRQSHKQIHDGLDALSALVNRFRSAPSTYSPTELRGCMDGFREVLMRHLDEEVNDLGGENMRKYWTLEEMDNFAW